MTDKEIIKALECCKKDDCDNCPNDFGNCYANLAGYAFDLINRQQAEIERLREIRDLCNTTILEKNEQIENLKISDASKEECTIKQHGEIKELKAEISVKNKLLDIAEEKFKTIRAEAIKEFAERLTHTLVINNEENTDYFDFGYTLETIDTLAKEMTGETKPEKCDCFCEEQRIKGWLDGNTPITEPITVCNGTRERDECTCGGDKSKCDFYAKDYSYGY